MPNFIGSALFTRESQHRTALGVRTCNSVEKCEVLKVGDLSPLPALGHVGGFEKLPRGGQGDASEKNILTLKQNFLIKVFLNFKAKQL